MVKQVGEELVRSPPYRSSSVPAGPWIQFCYSSQKAPHGEYFSAVEQACLNLEPHSVEELTAEIRGAFKHAQNSRRNITKEEAQVLAEPKKDHSRVIITADKGVALVVMDRAEYNKKAQKLLEDRGTFKEIQDRPHK